MKVADAIVDSPKILGCIYHERRQIDRGLAGVTRLVTSLWRKVHVKKFNYFKALLAIWKVRKDYRNRI